MKSPSKPSHWGAIFALWFAGLCAAGEFAKFGVLWAELQGRWPDGGAFLGLTVSVVGVIGIVFGTTAGLVVDRIGARRMILWALPFGAILSLVQALGLPLSALFATRVLEGFAHLAIVVAGPVLIAAAASPKDQAAAMTLWSTFFGIAFAVTAALGLPFVMRFGPEALWAVHGGLMVIAWLLLLWALPGGSAAAPVADAPARGGIIGDHLRIYASPRVAAPALGFVFYTLMFVAAMTLIPGLVEPAWRGPIAAVMPLAAIVASLVLGVQMSHRLGAVRTAQAGFLVAAVAALAWAGSGGMLQIAAALLISVGLGFAQGASFAAIPELNPKPGDRAKAAGAIAQLGNVGTTLGTPLLVILVDRLGAVAISLYVVPLSILGFVVHIWLARRRARLRDLPEVRLR